MLGISTTSPLLRLFFGSTILGKFEKEKYIKEIQVEGRKRTYQITDKGRRAYEEELQRLRQCVADAEGDTYE